MRRALLLLVLLAVAAAAAWTVLRWDRVAATRSDPWQAVPTEAAVIVEVPDAVDTWDRFSHASLIWRQWEQRPAAKHVASWMARVQQRLDADPKMRASITDGSLLIVIMRAGSSGAQPIVIGSCAACDAESGIGAFLGVEQSRWQELADGKAVPANQDSVVAGLTTACRNGLWMQSPSPFLIDEALLQLQRGSPLTNDVLFAQARGTLAPDADARIMLRSDRFINLLSDVWEQSTLERIAAPSGWLALDLRSHPDAVLLSGLLAPVADHPLSKSLQAQGNGAWEIARVLPASVSAFEVRHVSDADAAMDDVRALDDRARATECFADWMLGPVGAAYGLAPERTYLVATMSEPERAAAALLAPCATGTCDTLSHRGTRITRAPGAAPYELLLGRTMRLPQQPWWALLGNEAVLSDDVDAVKAAIDAWIDGGSLAEEPRARSWFKQMSGEAGLTWWCDMARGGELLLRGIGTDRQNDAPSWRAFLSQLASISVQASPAPNGWLHLSIGLQASAQQSMAPTAQTESELWRCPIGAPAAALPWVVLNHTNNTREVLVQDSLNRIHLISPAGKLLWSRALDSRILGGVHQVDRFRNGKLQLLLTTATTAYLIDRNGKDVLAPHRFPAGLAAPIAPFDYDGKREYRIIAALDDGRLLNFDLDWREVQGWQAAKLESPAVSATHHLRIANKDYLLVALRDGAVKLLDRKGNERDKSPTRLERIRAVLAVEAGQSLHATTVIWIDEDMLPHATALDGTDRSSTLQGEWNDLDSDGRPELLTDAAAANTGAPLGKASARLLPIPGGGTASGLEPAPWRYQRSTVIVAGPSLLADLTLDGRAEIIMLLPDGTVVAKRAVE